MIAHSRGTTWINGFLHCTTGKEEEKALRYETDIVMGNN